MIESCVVFVGGALGAVLVLTVLRRWSGLFTVLAVSVVTSFLLGVCKAGFPHSPGFTAFLGAGVCASAASFIMVAAQSQLLPGARRSSFGLLRYVTVAMVVQAVFCVAFVMVGYLTVDFAILLHRKLFES